MSTHWFHNRKKVILVEVNRELQGVVYLPPGGCQSAPLSNWPCPAIMQKISCITIAT